MTRAVFPKQYPLPQRLIEYAPSLVGKNTQLPQGKCRQERGYVSEGWVNIE